MDAPRGLSQAEATRRLIASGPNELPAAKPRRLVEITLSVAREPMLLLLIATGVIYLGLGDTTEALAIVGAIALVVGLTVYQEHKTERTLDALRDLSSPRALVLRNGAAVRVAGREVVPGDVLILNEGDRVAADGLLASAVHLSIDESLLTGESVPVLKQPDNTTSVFSGTLVVAGQGRAVVTATGAGTELGRIGTSVSSLETGRTPLETEVARMVRALAILGLATCGAVGVLYGVTRHNWLDGALAGLTMAISMIPEEFPVILTVFLALGAWRISRSNVLTRRMPAIETLGAATVLCVDKTGTLTLNHMAVAAVHPDGDRRTIIEFAMLASKPEPFDPMERAFLDSAAELGIRPPSGRGWELSHEYPMSNDLPAVGHGWRIKGEDRSTSRSKARLKPSSGCAR